MPTPAKKTATSRRSPGAGARRDFPSATRSNAVLITALVAVFAAVVTAVVLVQSRGDSQDTSSAAAGQAVRADSRVLDSATSGGVTFVEFLDFECEACGAAYPVIEQLREDYAGQVTFVLRYFPGTGHFNAENAALSVEAAAQQGFLEQMYDRMYETQTEWAEGQSSEADRFRGYAEDLGLDMAAYDQAVADPATLDRVLSDREDGLALGVEGTPTFFVNGTELEPQSWQDVTDALDAALAEQG